MKRISVVLGVILILGGGILSAESSIWIDFTNLEADDEIGGRKVNKETLVDYSTGQIFQGFEGKRSEMVVSLALDEWELLLASSSQTVENIHYSLAKEVTSKKFGKVLGARIHFPAGDYNSWAMVRPPFEIPAYQHPTRWDNGELKNLTQEEIDQANTGNNKKPGESGYVDKNSKFDTRGVVKNVGIIKEIKVQVYGANYPHGLSLRYKDQNSEVHDIFMDHLNFDGWKEIVWTNPNYISEVRNREMRVYPLYPQAFPFVKFLGFIIHRDGSTVGGDFVVYFKDVNVIFDKAVITEEKDIDDEVEWGILSAREEARRSAEIKRVGNIQLLRFIEKQKQALDTETFMKKTEEGTPGGQ